MAKRAVGAPAVSAPATVTALEGAESIDNGVDALSRTESSKE